MDKFEKEILGFISKEAGLDDVQLEKPAEGKHGDYAFPCFQLAKKERKSPSEIAKALAQNFQPTKLVARAEAIGPYLNFFVDRAAFSTYAAKEVLKKKAYGKAKSLGSRVMIEYSQVNTHKAFHVGHLRGTLIGASLVNIMRFCGHTVISANYQGDVGAHVAKSLWYLTKHYKGDYPKERRGEWLGKIYQEANALLSGADDPLKEQYKKEVSEVQQRLESHEDGLTKLWKKTRKWSLDDFSEFYRTLGIKFDRLFFESEFEQPGKDMVQALAAKAIAYKDDGAMVIDLEKHGLGVFVVLKSDGTALYSTKDLALAKEKFETYKIDLSWYVVGMEQNLYLKQLFKTLDIMGFENARNCRHIAYELVNLAGGKISSREGELVLAQDLVREAQSLAMEEVKKRHADWGKAREQRAANRIALAAVKFSMLNHDSNRLIVFDIKKALDFEGETGPYVQYAHARIESIFREHGKEVLGKADLGLLVTDEEFELGKLLLAYPGTVQQASQSAKPAVIAHYLIELAQAFNCFYHKHHVLKAEAQLKNARLTLCAAVRNVLASGLELLGIDAPEEM